MSEVTTFECDVCKTRKQLINHWWAGKILSVGPNDAREVIGVEIIKHEKRGLSDIDLCGQACAIQWLGQKMQEIVGN